MMIQSALNIVAPAQPEQGVPSHNQMGQRLGRKGLETRDRIISAMLSLLSEPDNQPVTLTTIAKAADVHLTNLYRYFPDLGSLLLAALDRLMASADAVFLNKLRNRWSDETLFEDALEFLQAHFSFWQNNARLLHLRNSLADNSDLRVVAHRNTTSKPAILQLARQLSAKPDSLISPNNHLTAIVLHAGIERLATVLTNPLLAPYLEDTGGRNEGAHSKDLICAEAEILSVTVREKRRIG
jgi:AcrR family transcriptional regulator